MATWTRLEEAVLAEGNFWLRGNGAAPSAYQLALGNANGAIAYDSTSTEILATELTDTGYTRANVSFNTPAIAGKTITWLSPVITLANSHTADFSFDIVFVVSNLNIVEIFANLSNTRVPAGSSITIQIEWNKN